jgi:hypothetical protein
MMKRLAARAAKASAADRPATRIVFVASPAVIPVMPPSARPSARHASKRPEVYHRAAP